ncbi:MAG: carbohydrate-binding domain-containing protein [Clostridia bacterium]|nr:carbohydrate-binding domain-containing protein [Clostridia bacterium]
MKKAIVVVTALITLLLCSCDTVENGASSSNSNASVDTGFEAKESEMFTGRDKNDSYSEEDAVRITLLGSGAEASSDSVEISGNTVTLKAEETYIISGNLNGTLTVDTDGKAKPHIIFNGVNITADGFAALYVKEADKVVITLAKGSENSLTSVGAFRQTDGNGVDAAVFSKQDITFNGSGSLTVSSPSGHGITSKDDLVFTGGSYRVNAGLQAIDANDSIRIAKGTSFEITAGKDGLHAENNDDDSLGFIYLAGGSFDITSKNDGISAGAYLQAEDGEFNITASGSSGSMKGIKAVGTVLINGGRFTVNSKDDAVHSNSSVVINGGSLEITTDDDGIHADESLVIKGGAINITKCYEGLEALNVSVEGGAVSLIATDDGINAAGGKDGSGFGGGGGFGKDHFGKGGKGGFSMGNNLSKGSITVSGGTVYIQSSGDGMDANGTLLISGGFVTVCGPTKGDTATLDYDISGSITGGTFIGTGSANMAQTFSDASQGVIAGRVGNVLANTRITLKDGSGKVIIDHTPVLDYAVIIVSSPELVSGESYELTIGDETVTVKAG